MRGSEYRLFELSIPIITSFSFEGEITLREQAIFPGIPSNLHLFGTVGPASPNAIAADPTIPETIEGEEAPEAVSVSPAYLNLLGTDNAARDMLSRLLYGGRISLSIGLIGIAISFPLGLLVGGISGYFGGWIDSVLMRLVEVIMTIPSLYLLVALGVILPPELSSSERFLLIILIISFDWLGRASPGDSGRGAFD